MNIHGITNKQMDDSETMERFNTTYQYFANKRSHIIECALQIESFLKVVLLHFFAGEDYPKHKLLRVLVFEPESFTFMDGRKLLSRIFELFGKEITCISSEEAKDMRRKIQEIIKIRNMFAHGEIYINCPTGEAYVSYYLNGIVEQKLDEKMIDDFEADCTYADEKLSELNEFFRKNSFDLGGYGE